jgi:cephalosporin hydroxylase
LIWSVQPDLIIETGIARGGSLIFYASILELVAQCGGNNKAKILGIDIDIREHNRSEILSHPMSKRIEMIQGSSISDDTFKIVKDFSKDYKKILICLDSNHTHEHVLEELKLYAPLVSKGSYCVVFDTMVEDMPDDRWSDRPWGKSNNPKTAVLEYLKKINESSLTAYDGERLVLTIDKQIENQLLITVAPGGFLRRE